MNQQFIYDQSRQYIRDSYYQAEMSRMADLAQTDRAFDNRTRVISWLGERLILLGTHLKRKADAICTEACTAARTSSEMSRTNMVRDV